MQKHALYKAAAYICISSKSETLGAEVSRISNLKHLLTLRKKCQSLNLSEGFELVSIFYQYKGSIEYHNFFVQIAKNASFNNTDNLP